MSYVHCIRCDTRVSFDQMVDVCSSNPEGGPHEGIAPPSMRQSGWSLHAKECPRGALYMTGHELSDGACMCKATRP